jgi:hypothetical protein
MKTAIQMAIDKAAPKRAAGVQIALTCEDDKCNEVAAFHAARRLARAGVSGWHLGGAGGMCLDWGWALARCG